MGKSLQKSGSTLYLKNSGCKQNKQNVDRGVTKRGTPTPETKGKVSV